MKKTAFFLTCMALLMAAGRAGAVLASDVNSLIIYYSYSGVTETLANAIANDCGGTLLEVVDHGNYPRPESSTTYNYANNERSQIDAGNWPEIKTEVDNFDQWDAIIICTPLWNGKMANPMLTFLHNHASKLAGKQVALAVTSWSSGITNVVNDAHNQLPNCTFVGNALHINYNNRSNITTMAHNWISALDFEAPVTAGDLRVIVGNKTFTATLADNATADAFKALLPLTLDMTELNGNEKYNYLNTNLPSAATNPGTIHSGDIMLYGRNCVVLFYETFNTSYSYTRIGAIDDPTGLSVALGSGNVTVKFEMATSSLKGDVNGDGAVNVTDVTAVIDFILGGENIDFDMADFNGDGSVNISDVSEIIDYIIAH